MEEKKHIKDLGIEIKASDNTWKDKVAYRKSNKSWLNKSAKIAVKVARILREKNMTQKSLAELMEVSPQQVNKILKGRENLTLETISKIESILGVELVSILKSDEYITNKQSSSLYIKT
ncbi:MAG: helix-turn-helix transcriptional regulator [Cyclobacteriaceae bacterium]